jgi:pimeloyl-ACP methyl ester carboxylesterase
MQGNLPVLADAAPTAAWMVPDATWRTVSWPDQARTIAVGPDRLAYVELGSGDPPVLFLHGLGGNWTAWLENLPAVARERRVVAVDLPGFGRSRPASDGISIPGYARTIERFCDELGLERFVVVGNSLGGWVAAELALRIPSRMEALVLVDAAGIVPTRLERTKAVGIMRGAALGAPLAPRFRRSVAARPRLRKMALKYTAAEPAGLAADLVYMALPEAPDPGFAPAFTAARRSWSDAWCDRLTEVECPALIVWGERDSLLPVRHGREWARRLRGSELLVIKEAGHLPMLERPAEFNAALLAFLGRMDATGLALEAAPQANDAVPPKDVVNGR